MLKSWLKSFFTDKRSAMVIRWWAAGAVYFFIGWGTSAGQSMIELVFSLGLVMALLNILIINPSLRMVFNIGNKRPQQENTFFQRLSDRLLEFIKTLFIVFIVAIIYEVLNRVIIALLNLPTDTVPFPGEPIMFGVFYVFVLWCIDLMSSKIKDSITSNREAKSEERSIN